MKLSVVIVNWNASEFLSQCLDSIKKHLVDLEYEVIVVDNASQDKSCEVLKNRYPWAVLIENKVNQGFARANNQGFAIAKGKYILILNPDILIKENSIQNLIKILEEDRTPSVGIVGPRIVDDNGLIAPECKRRFTSLPGIFRRRFLLNRTLYLLAKKFSVLKHKFEKTFYKSEYAECLQGACMLVRKSDLDKIGYFDEQVPMYLDDVDLCYRFYKAGLKAYYCAESEIIHYCAASTKKAQSPKLLDLYSCQAADVFFFKHKNLGYVVLHHLILFLSAFFFILADIILLPISFILKPKAYLSFVEKHFTILVYALSGRISVPEFENYHRL